MKNFEATSRTNYFRVTDEERYDEIFTNLVFGEAPVIDLTKIIDGKKYHAFGSCSSINNYHEEEDEDPIYPFDIFVEEIQKILPEDEAFIYMEAGSQDIATVCGNSIVVTKKAIECINLSDFAIKSARRLLGNEEFTTDIEF